MVARILPEVEGMKKLVTSWGEVAEWYDALLDDPDSFQRRVILPNLLRVLNLKPGERVLDVGCGQGFFSRAFWETGANVLGVDIAPELIALAQRNVPKSKTGRRLEFTVAAADRLDQVADHSVDTVTLVMAIQNIENLHGVFQACQRVLKPGGHVVMVLNHPAFRIPQGSSWGSDGAKIQYRRVDRYLSEARVNIQMHPGANPRQRTVTFHRPLQLYFKALAKHGFCVRRLEEWISHRVSQPGPRAAAEDRTRKEIPLFLFLEATKHFSISNRR